MIAALLFLAQLAPEPAEAKPISTTIAAIVANPKKFDGGLVRLHGWLNSCQPSACVIDERAASAPNGAGQHLTVAGDQKFYDTVKPLLPTYVEFDASVTAACVASPCVGSATALNVVTLRGVVSPEPPPFENP